MPALKLACALIAAAAFAGAAVGCAVYPGSGAVFIFFNLAFALLLGLALPQPRLHAYTFLAALLVLGFWVKLMFQLLVAPGFVEPVGDFDGSGAQWDRALLVAAWGALGAGAARLAHLRLAGRARGAPAGRVPEWFARRERLVWTLTMAVMLAANAANLHFAFHQIGVIPRLLLPLGGHVVLGWLVNIGFALWMAVLFGWSWRLGRATAPRAWAPLGEAFIASVSTFSRIAFLLRWLAYLLAGCQRLSRRSIYALLAGGVVLFAISVVAVFTLRVYYFHGYAAGEGQVPLGRDVESTLRHQLPALVIHRWVGLESVLAVTAAERSPQRLRQALTEPPALAERSLFQQVARPAYFSERPEQFVFLANAGPLAVLWFSGSLAVVFAGMALVGSLMLATEELARRCIANPFLLALAGASLANVVSQTSFFYLTGIFLLQLWLALALVLALERT